ncbi:hypothetical protein [Streptomyces sp. NPDC002845]
MTDPTTGRLTDTDLDEIAAWTRSPLGPGVAAEQRLFASLVAEVRRLRAVPSAPAGRAALRDRIAEALYCHEWPHKQIWQQALAMDRETFLAQADAVLAVLPSPVDRAAVLREVAEVVFALDFDELRATDSFDSHRQAWELGTIDAHNLLRRMADEAQQPEARTPCSEPNGCDPDGDLCDQHETELAHAEGEHAFCGVTCEVEFPTEMLRNGILAKGYPGTAGMLDELLRRAATEPKAAVVESEPDDGPRLLFWEGPAGASFSDGRVTVPISRGVNLAEFAPVGDLVLPLQSAQTLRDTLSRLLREGGAGPLPADEAQPCGTRPCGHDDYHDAHPWHDRPDVWCPGITVETPAEEPRQ